MEPQVGASGSRSTDNPMAAVRRSFETLRCFVPENVWLSHGEIARRTRIPKATMTRLVRTLTELGYLNYDPDSRRYSLAAATVPFGQSYLKSIDLRGIARPLMLKLARELNANVHLGVRSGLEIMLVESCLNPSGYALISLGIGSTVPIEANSLGRAYIASAADAEREEIFAALRERYGQRWPQLEDRLIDSTSDYRRLGYAKSFGEWRSDQNGIAVALLGTDSSKPYVINCGGAAFHLSEEYLLKSAVPKLLALARHVSRLWKHASVATDTLAHT
ncbi:MAG: IclR family transcriptional regulator [Vicinamibacterales bacterium]